MSHNQGYSVMKRRDAQIAVMGATGTGKSSFVKAVTNDRRVHIGHCLDSETDTITLSRFYEEPDARCVTLIDTPGFDDSRGAAGGLSDADILRKIAAYLEQEYDDDRKLDGLIYLHRISDVRVGNTSQRNLRMFRKLVGSQSMKNVVIVTTMWDLVPRQEAERRERELMTSKSFFKTLLDNGAELVRFGRNCQGEKFQPPLEVVSDLLKWSEPEWLCIQTEMDEGKGVAETSAGSELSQELRALITKHQNQMRELRQELAEALQERDMRLKRELDVERSKLEHEVKRWERERQRLREDLDSLRATAERQKIVSQTRLEQERAEYKRTMPSWTSSLADGVKAGASIFSALHGAGALAGLHF
ncbi:hypothetical protein JAAARDRAFT_72807 [Jaapia argillacea MUCL 33604]|uniref:G domain-containing protein n=1 Tax=Jaapia argillacea MUCL 33604 TaxID=933084 RepID=A0A067PP21_9AGAM|nr:hypothetical protein JAAARDRAFT_72807 [Jaapia argillacea MUCL 33604]